mmetsp:Transcript_44784/g.95288  ORF Transcript_44784/g.95288 Transcript_44784/m.95288 type:complete len:229 (-) Transcript_44784:419-1105(-)
MTTTSLHASRRRLAIQTPSSTFTRSTRTPPKAATSSRPRPSGRARLHTSWQVRWSSASSLRGTLRTARRRSSSTRMLISTGLMARGVGPCKTIRCCLVVWPRSVRKLMWRSFSFHTRAIPTLVIALTYRPTRSTRVPSRRSGASAARTGWQAFAAALATLAARTARRLLPPPFLSVRSPFQQAPVANLTGHTLTTARTWRLRKLPHWFVTPPPSHRRSGCVVGKCAPF